MNTPFFSHIAFIFPGNPLEVKAFFCRLGYLTNTKSETKGEIIPVGKTVLVIGVCAWNFYGSMSPVV